jgi:hypothetical protein
MSIAAMKQALEALDTCHWDYDSEEESYKTFDEDLVNDAIEALRQAIEQAEKPTRNAADFLAEKQGAFRDPRVLIMEFYKPEQEPVAVWELQGDGWNTIADAAWMETLPVGTKLYTAPPKRKNELDIADRAYFAGKQAGIAEREWVGLTDEEIDKAIISTAPSFKPDDVARAIEAKLKERNT